MFCDKCGKEIKEGNTFCTNCGNNVNENIDNKKKTITINLHQFLTGIIVLVLIIALLALYIVNKNKTNNVQTDNSTISSTNSQVDNVDKKISNPIAIIDVADYGTIKLELYSEQAPNTVKNFISLANNGFYDNLTFHRIIYGFMIQGGDKNGDGTGNPSLSDINKTIQKSSSKDKEYTIKGEFKENGVNNELKLEKGTIAMARADYTAYSDELLEQSYNSAGSQFFIMTEDNLQLDGFYATFGKVIEGMDIVKQIEYVGTDEDGTPYEAPIIKSIRVETNGNDYGLPKTGEVFNFKEWFLGKIKKEYPDISEYVFSDDDNYWLLHENGKKIYFYDIESFARALQEFKTLSGENTSNENNNSSENNLSTDNEGFIRIPDLTGMTEQQAINKAKELNVPYKVVYREDLSYEKEGIVIDQTTHTQILKDIKGNIVAAYSLRILKPRRNTCYYSK